MKNTNYNPDVLSCLANLSSDEVFTPPVIANRMLDLLPEELWRNPEARFLDPAAKTGIFLREIAKRLMRGLEEVIPDKEERVNHIMTRQLFGLAITGLTALLSRRSLYCTKTANSRYSVCTEFPDADGNIGFTMSEHSWQGDRCRYCGASRQLFDRDEGLEQHAYQFIHTNHPEKLFENMKFDVIIGNPPYQLSDGGAQASAKPIYNLFVEQAKKLNPNYLIMIIPSRWMTGGKGLDKFRDDMIHDRRISVLHDFANSEECFTGVDIKGGVCYFLWERNHNDKCDIYRHDSDGVIQSLRYLAEGGEDIYIRYPILVSIKNKISSHNEKSFDTIVSSRKPYGLASDFLIDPSKFDLPPVSDKKIDGGYSILGLIALNRVMKYVPKDYPFPKRDRLNKYKVFITNAYGCGEIGEGPATPVLATPGEACTETFLEVGNFDNLTESRNVLSYIKTKFFRCIVGIRKQTQHATKQVYQYVPMQDFTDNSDIDWNRPVAEIDRQLYKKYSLTQEEIDFIETMIRPME